MLSKRNEKISNHTTSTKAHAIMINLKEFEQKDSKIWERIIKFNSIWSHEAIWMNIYFFPNLYKENIFHYPKKNERSEIKRKRLNQFINYDNFFAKEMYLYFDNKSIQWLNYYFAIIKRGNLPNINWYIILFTS